MFEIKQKMNKKIWIELVNMIFFGILICFRKQGNESHEEGKLWYFFSLLEYVLKQDKLHLNCLI